MAAVATATRALRLDAAAAERMSSGTMSGAAAIVLGSYLMFAVDRFGFLGFLSPRATVRLMLSGLYGWLALTAAIWLIVRLLGKRPVSIEAVLRVVGRAHFPLLMVAIFIQVFGVLLQSSGVAVWPALFGGLVWMPATLVLGLAAATGLSRGTAVLVIAGPYAAWALVIGRHVWLQVGHLL